MWLSATSANAADEVVTLQLKNGGSVRGELVESVPNEKFVLKLATGEIRTVPWADVTAPEQAGHAPAPPPAHTAPPAPAPAPPPAPRTVHVTFTSEDGGELQSYLGSSTGTVSSTSWGPNGSYSSGGYVEVEHYQFVCSAPCSKDVDPGATYRIGGTGKNPSRPFNLSGNTQLTAEVGGNLGRMLGIPTAASGGILGVSTAALGGILLGSGKSEGLGAALVGTGVGLLVILVPLGIYLRVSNATEVKDGAGNVIAKRPRLSLEGVHF